jgi:hypothetical protein
MAKKSKKPLDILRNKQDKLDWHKFNFLENLLVFCVLPEKSVPKESGVHFRITPRTCHDSLCLLFKIDRGRDSLFADDEIKPDYMTLFLQNNFWLFTIIEMKGTTEKGIKHGVEQIKALKNRLRDELRDNFPNKFRVKFQAIILSPTGTQTPDPFIAKESKAAGIVIKPLQYHHKAELFDYVSQELKLTTEKYKHQEIKCDNNPLFTEFALSNGALPERLSDNFCMTNKDKASNKQGIYINYAVLENPDYPELIIDSNNDYTAVTIDTDKIKIAVKDAKETIKNQLQADLESIGLQTQKHFEIEEIEN